MTNKGFHIPTANYFGLMNPTPTYMAVLAEALVAALNPQLASVARSQFASTLEAETIGWVASRFGWHKPVGAEPAPPALGPCDGTFTSGGNEANFTGLALAISQSSPTPSKMASPPSAPVPSFTPRPSRIIRWKSRRACSGWTQSPAPHSGQRQPPPRHRPPHPAD